MGMQKTKAEKIRDMCDTADYLTSKDGISRVVTVDGEDIYRTRVRPEDWVNIASRQAKYDRANDVE